MRLRGEVEDGVDVVPLEAVDDLGRVGDVPLVECEVAPVVEDARVVEGRAVVQLVKRDDVVSVRVSEGEVADEPTCSATESATLRREAGYFMGDMIIIHEAGPARDHDVLDIWPGLELGGANKHRGFPPDAIVLEEAVWLTEALGEVMSQ